MDRTCKRILNDMIGQGKGTKFVYGLSETGVYLYGASIDDLAKTLELSVDDVMAAVRYLEAENYLEYQKTVSKNSIHNIGISLSHKGLNWKYFRRKEILDYIADKWVDFFAALIALLSLIISIVALAQ